MSFYTQTGLEKLGRIIRLARGEKSLREFAEITGLSHSNIERLELAEIKNPLNEKLARIAPHLGLSLGEIIAIASEKERVQDCESVEEVLQMLGGLTTSQVKQLIGMLQQRVKVASLLEDTYSSEG